MEFFTFGGVSCDLNYLPEEPLLLRMTPSLAGRFPLEVDLQISFRLEQGPGAWVWVGPWIAVTRPWIAVTRPWIAVTRPWIVVTRPWIVFTRPWIVVTRPWIVVTRPWIVVTRP